MRWCHLTPAAAGGFLHKVQISLQLTPHSQSFTLLGLERTREETNYNYNCRLQSWKVLQTKYFLFPQDGGNYLLLMWSKSGRNSNHAEVQQRLSITTYYVTHILYDVKVKQVFTKKKSNFLWKLRKRSARVWEYWGQDIIITPVHDITDTHWLPAGLFTNISLCSDPHYTRTYSDTLQLMNGNIE